MNVLVYSQETAVVKSEAKPFREARDFLPELKAATRWAAIEQSWGYCRASASELARRREDVTRSSTAAGAATVASATTSTFPESAATAAAGISTAAMAASTATPAAAPGLGGAEDGNHETDVYCICREGDDGGVMVECDVCSEWFHASCVGLTALPEGELQYQCLVCCEMHPEKHGHYKHRWTTNVAVEASVRRSTPRRTKNKNTTSPKLQSQTHLPEEVAEAAIRYQTLSARQTASGANVDTNLADGEGMAERTESTSGGRLSKTARQGGADDSKTVHDSNGCIGGIREPTLGVEASAEPADLAASADLPETKSFRNSKRLRDTCSRSDGLPGAKRARAAGAVTAFVERHYLDLGIPWPPERPSSPENPSEDCCWDGNDDPQRSERCLGDSSSEMGCELPAAKEGMAGEPSRGSCKIGARERLEMEATDKHDGEDAEEPPHLALRPTSVSASTDLLVGHSSAGYSSGGNGSGSGLGQGAFNAHVAPRQGGRHVCLHELQQYQGPKQQQQDQPQHLQDFQQQPQQQLQPFQGEEQRVSGISWTQPPLSPVQGLPVLASRPSARESHTASDDKSSSSHPATDPADLATPGAAGAPWSEKTDATPHKDADGEGTGRSGVAVAKRAAEATHIVGAPATSTPVPTATAAWSSHEERETPVGHKPSPPPGNV